MPDGRGSSSGPLVAKGKVIQGMGGCQRVHRAEVLHQRLRRRRPASSSGGSTPSRSDGEPGGDTWGSAAEPVPRRRRDVDHRQLRSRSRTSPTGARRRPSRGCRSAAACTTLDKALYTSSTRRARRRHRQAGVVLPARARRGARPRRGLRARARRRRRPEAGVHRRQGRHPVEARSQDRQVSSATRRRSSRTSGTASTRRPATPTLPRRTSSTHEVGQWIDGCPSTEGGHNWQAMSYHPPTNSADHPAQPELHRDSRAEDRAEGRRRQRRRRRSALLRDAGHRRQHRQARRVRRQHA